MYRVTGFLTHTEGHDWSHQRSKESRSFDRAVNRQRYASSHGNHWVVEETSIDIRHFDLNLNLVSIIISQPQQPPYSIDETDPSFTGWNSAAKFRQMRGKSERER